MSDSEQDASVLGKREREEEEKNGPLAEDGPVRDASANEDESDEDVGPMPMPANANGTMKKKRKGMSPLSVHAITTLLRQLSCGSPPPREIIPGSSPGC
jgi:hypothetical protein